MLPSDSISSTASNTRKHHRIHPVAERNSNTSETSKGHVAVNLSTLDDDRVSLHQMTQRTHSQASNSSSSIDIRATDVIKRITSPSGVMSTTDEILPQTLFRRMSTNFNINSFVQGATSNSTSGVSSLPIVSSSSTLPPVHDVPSTMISDDHDPVSTLASSTTMTQINIISTLNECEICYSSNDCVQLKLCPHLFCHTCLSMYLQSKIRGISSATIECPHDGCKEMIHPSDIRAILNDAELYERYETFMLRRVLQKMPDTRWCPYPNCTFALLVENTRKASPYNCLICHQPFCQRCSQIWHPNLSCSSAAGQRAAQDITLEMLVKTNLQGGFIRPCPRCKSPIEKLNDGSCNHIRCAICTCEFCWLCMKEVDNLHFITPTGCTFYGKQRWPPAKSIFILIVLWLFTPPILLLSLIIFLPILLVYLPFTITRRFYRFTNEANFECCCRTWSNISICLLAILLTPLILALAVIIGVPLIVFFVYLYMPIRCITANF